MGTLSVSVPRRSSRLRAQLLAPLEPALQSARIRRLELSLVPFYLAEFATWVAILVFAYQTGGVAASGLVGFFLLAPAALIAPFAAALTRQYFEGQVLVAGYVAQAVMYAATGMAMALGAPLPVVVALAAAACICLTGTWPSLAGILPSLAETPQELAGACAVAGWIESWGFVAGPAIGSLLLFVAGPPLVFLVMAIGLSVSAVLASGLEPSRSAASESVLSIAANLKAGLHALATDRASAAVTSFMGVHYVILGAIDVLLVTLAFRLLHLGQSGVGLLSTAFGLGCVIGASMGLLLASGRRLTGGLAVGAAAWGLGLTLISVTPGRFFAALLITVAGMGRPLITVSGRVLLQRVVSDSAIIPLFAVLEGLSMAAMGLGLAFTPAVIGNFGTRASFLAVGLLLPVLVVLLFRPLSALEAKGTVPEDRLVLLRSTSFFAPLSLIAIDRLARAMIPVEAAPGEAVVRQGERGDRFYLVASGRLTVEVDSRTVGMLGDGDFFGEIALLRGGLRTATVIADAPVHLYALDRNDFLTAVTGHPESTARAAAVVDHRLGAAAPLESAPNVSSDR